MGRTGAWKVPGYVADELIGRGSTGHVWRGRAVRSGERVALKRLPGSDPDRLRAARAEAALLSALDHPNLIRLRELVPTPNAVVLVLDLADGGSLASLLDRRGHLTVGEMVSALAPIGAALAFAHDQGVVHGDVSPANVLFSVRGLPLLADLGVARLLGDESSAASTLGYLDPAVAAGSPPGSASDVFMLAAAALHCLDGRPPWCADSADELVAMAAIGEIHGLDQRLRAAPDSLATVLRRGLSAAPHARGTAAEFALDLRHAAAPVAVELAAGRSDRGPGSSPGRGRWPRGPASEGAVGLGPHRPRHAVASAAVNAPTTGATTGATTASATRSAPPPWRTNARGGPRIERPDFHRVGPVELAGAAGEVGALPLTHAVRAQLRPPPPPAPWWRGLLTSRTTAWCSALLLVAVAAAVGVGWWRSFQGAGASAGAAVRGPAPRAAATPSLAMRLASTAPPRPDASAMDPSAPPTTPIASTPTPTPARTSSASTRPAAELAGWAATLAALDAGRSRAFAGRDAAALGQVWLPGPLLRQDTASLTRLVPAGCGLVGLRTSYANVREVRRSATAASVTATADLAAARVVCREVVLTTTAPRTGVAMTIGLVITAGGWRIASLVLR